MCAQEASITHWLFSQVLFQARQWSLPDWKSELLLPAISWSALGTPTPERGVVSGLNTDNLIWSPCQPPLQALQMHRVKLWAMEQLLCSPSADTLTCAGCGQHQPGYLPFQGICFPPTGHAGIPMNKLSPGNHKSLRVRAALQSMPGVCWSLHASCLMDDVSAHTGTYLHPEGVYSAGNCPGDMKLNCRQHQLDPRGTQERGGPRSWEGSFWGK